MERLWLPDHLQETLIESSYHPLLPETIHWSSKINNSQKKAFILSGIPYIYTLLQTKIYFYLLKQLKMSINGIKY